MAVDRPDARTRSASRTGFRDDIQGMRALAVLAIMAFHAGFSPYSGGFVTLDVFFVISGFLITSLLLREIEETGTLSLRRFYERRARRILPAATVATVGILIASWTWLSLVEAEDAATDARWAALFVANIRFAIEETDYFSSEEPASPFQHYWSLSVEEQFYAVLPLLLLACVLLAAWAGRRTGSARRHSIVGMLVLVTAASFAWSVYASYTGTGTAYFSTFTRTWEFGVGALLAVAAVRVAGRLTPRARNVLGAAGLAAIALACFTITETTAFPGYVALLPVLGTGAVMIAGAELGQRPPPVVQRVLGATPLRQIGDMSYSLYLWHWPVLVIATEHLGRQLTARETATAFVAIVALSWLSYRLVETPFRRGMPPRLGRGLVLYPLTLTLVAMSANSAMSMAQDGLDTGEPAITLAQNQHTPAGRQLDGDPTIAIVEASARAAADGEPVPGGLEPALDDLADDKADLGDCNYAQDSWELCPRGDTDAERTMVVLGDSHARHWIPALDRIAEQTGYTVYYLALQLCTPARVEMARTGDPEAGRQCQDFNDWAQEQIVELRPSLVLVSTAGSRRVVVDGSVRTDPDEVTAELRAGYQRLFDDLEPYADRVVLLGDVPRRQSDPAECLGQRDATLATCDNSEDPWEARLRRVSERAARASDAEYVATDQWFCADGVCPPVIGSTVPMRDAGHATTKYVERLTGPLRRALRLPTQQPG